MSTPTTIPEGPKLPKYDLHHCLKGQKAVVTGANSGIGEACAIGLAKAGADVLVNYVTDQPAAESVVKEIKSHGVDGFAFKCDVSQPDQVEAMFNAMDKKWGACHILVNNAGIQDDASFADMTVEQWNHVLGINLTGQFLCCKQAYNRFMKQGVVEEISVASGKIISITSVHQEVPWRGHVNYCAAKGALGMMNKTLAQEIGPRRIRINSIGPGAIKTPINTEAWSTPTQYGKLMELIPYNRIGVPEDIAQVCVWLASDHSDYLNGTTIYCDGGMMMYPGFRYGG